MSELRDVISEVRETSTFEPDSEYAATEHWSGVARLLADELEFLLDRVEKAEQEAFDFVKQKAKEGAREKRKLETRARRAEQALARVRELHRRQPDTISGLDTGPAYCRCGEHYPCPTIRALEGNE